MMVLVVTLAMFEFSAIGQELVSRKESALVEADADKTRSESEIDTDSEFQLFKKRCWVAIFWKPKEIWATQIKNKENEKDDREICYRKIADFEKRNTELKNRIANFKHTTATQWVSFKDFIRDMDQLEDEIRSMK